MHVGNFHQANCNNCCNTMNIEGCVSGVPYLLIVNYESAPAVVTNINLNTGVTGSGTPVGFVTGDCPSARDYEFEILCDSGNANTQFMRIVNFNTVDGTFTISNYLMDGVTVYVPVTPSKCTAETFDISAPIEYCDGGVALYATEIWNVSGAAPVFVSRIFRNAIGTVIIPSGTQTLGTCSTAITAGAAQIGSGTFATTLGINGTTWVAPAVLNSVTVRARRSNTTDARNTATNRIQVNFSGGSYIVLLTNEIVTWGVDDLNNLGSITNVQSFGNAAALITFN